MKVLALEFSTAAASLALLEDGKVVAAAPVDARLRRSQGLFDAAAEILAGARWTFADLDVFAVGRGPGSYTGLRVSLTAARGWALPGGKPVWTIDSPAALAAEIFAEPPKSSPVVVWGAARRDTIWAGLFDRPGQIGDYRLLSAEAHDPEWPEAWWIAPGRVPQAEWIGRLFFSGLPSAPLQPLYLHPPVSLNLKG